MSLPVPRTQADSLPSLSIAGLQRIGGFADPGFAFDLEWFDSASRLGNLSCQTGSSAWDLLFVVNEQAIWGQRIAVGYSTSTFGRRAHWVCPWCLRRCNMLFERNGRFACRKCQCLHYRSQRQSKLTRTFEQVLDLNEQLGRTSHQLWDPITARPSGMRWSRFSSLSRRFLSKRNTASRLIDELSKRFWAERECAIRAEPISRRRGATGGTNGVTAPGTMEA